MLWLSEGHYGLLDEQGNLVLPVLAFGGAEEWYAGRFGRSLEEGLDRAKNPVFRAQVVACLRSFLVGGSRDRRIVEDALARMDSEADRAEWLAARHDANRTSMTDIGGIAARLADRIEQHDWPKEA